MPLEFSKLTNVEDLGTLLASLTDLADGDIDNPETAEAIRTLGQMGVTFVRAALKAKSSLIDAIVGPVVAKAITDGVEKFIAEKTAKPA